ncbi:MAG TPA: endonuclease MutS2, partial [Bacteroidales bacterium]|nr:endonuclease MutS2 [Bacteroidales bacterium]
MNSDFQPDFEVKLGFDTIRRILDGHCLSSLGRARVAQIAFSCDGKQVRTALRQTAEMKDILQFAERFPSQDYYDLVPELVRIRIPGTFMEPEALAEFRLSLVTLDGLLGFLEAGKEKYPALFALARGEDLQEGAVPPIEMLPVIRSVITGIGRILDDRSEVRDSASSELSRIRKEKARLQSTIEGRIMQCFRNARQQGWTPEDAEVTIRNGRMVIPMVSTHKRRVPGFIHDESSTGHTVYVEPAEIFEINNDIRQLEYEERREIVKILTEFASFVRPHCEGLIQVYQFLGKVDVTRAKARFAIEVEANLPVHLPQDESGQPAFTWRRAMHPLLFLSHRRQRKNVVPLDIALSPDQRILIISGPNAGGKSVCLKTVGLVQYMLQCGLLPTAAEDSEFCLFNRILVDIGDEQSIDNDLSTYSSKLLNLKLFLENLDDRSLFLIDEMGTGTDPSLGGAIAEATLEALNAKSAMGIVTTHYSNLKLLAAREKGIINGAMLYDIKRMKPLFQLKAGKPGSSFAFEIATEIGFPAAVLEAAKGKTGKSQLDFDRELQNLEVEKQELTRKSTEVQVADEFLAELISRYEKLTSDLEAKKSEILNKARAEARNLLDHSNRLIEGTIREIRESQAEKERTRVAREKVAEAKQQLAQVPVAGKAEEGTGKKTVEEKQEGAVVIPGPVGSQAKPHRFQRYFDEIHAKTTSFTLTLDLRGKRVDEAHSLIQRYIDDAILCSIPEVQILHGKGN